VTVLVIACPHALGLAIPLVTAISTTIGARNGLLVRDRRGLEEARLLNTVVFDKTGTLTEGKPVLVHWQVWGDAEPAWVQRAAAALAGHRDAARRVAEVALEVARSGRVGRRRR